MMKQMMKQFDLNSMRLLAGVCGLFTILALTPGSVAQPAAAVQGGNVSAAAPATAAPAVKTGLAVNPAAKPAEEQDVAAPGKPGNEGIKVHGHWVLQVKNADGTLGERREFDNSLVTLNATVNLTGDRVLTALLSGNGVAGDPGIAFISTPVSPNCFISGCYMFVTDSTSLLPYYGNGLSYPNSGIPFETGLVGTVSFSSPVNWVLSGNYTVPSGLTSIGAVGTYLPLCMSKGQGFLSSNQPAGTYHDRSSDIASSACALNSSITTTSSGSEYIMVFPLTYTVVPSGPLAVTTGQIVTVTVTISFS
jgi:hypothetical protein